MSYRGLRLEFANRGAVANCGTVATSVAAGWPKGVMSYRGLRLDFAIAGGGFEQRKRRHVRELLGVQRSDLCAGSD